MTNTEFIQKCREFLNTLLNRLEQKSAYYRTQNDLFLMFEEEARAENITVPQAIHYNKMKVETDLRVHVKSDTEPRSLEQLDEKIGDVICYYLLLWAWWQQIISAQQLTPTAQLKLQEWSQDQIVS